MERRSGGRVGLRQRELTAYLYFLCIVSDPLLLLDRKGRRDIFGMHSEDIMGNQKALGASNTSHRSVFRSGANVSNTEISSHIQFSSKNYQVLDPGPLHGMKQKP